LMGLCGEEEEEGEGDPRCHFRCLLLFP
jgi:hypothetical protein